MPKVSWPDMMAIHSRLHLVVVGLPDAEQIGPDLKTAQATLARFLRHRVPGGVFGSSIVRAVSPAELHFAFPVETDARMFADELGADVVARYPGWASQRAGNVTVKKLHDIDARFAPPKLPASPVNPSVRPRV
jgi:hypothetical protein